MTRLGRTLLLLPFVAPAFAAGPAFAKHARPKHKSHHASRNASGEERERPVSTYLHDGRPNILAESAIVIDLATGKELFERHGDDVRPIASISKLMAMMVVLDHNLNLDLTTEVLPSDRDLARRGARSRLPTGRTFTNKDLLHAALMASDNRAVPALGRAVGLDPAALTAEMNKKARALGLVHTAFGDPTGLDDRNRSTSRELAKMLAAALKYPLITEITQKSQYLARAVDQPGYTVEYQNTDVIARGGKYQVLAGKTGYTDLAGYCLAIAAKIADGDGVHDVAMVFLGEHQKLTRFGDFSRTAQWVTEKGPIDRTVATQPLPAAPAPPKTASSSPL